MHRFLLLFFGGVLTLLLIWLLGFVLTDIGRVPGPDYGEIEGRHVDSAALARLREARGDLEEVGLEIENQREVQRILRASTDNSRATMGQLLQIHRMNLEKGVTPSEDEQGALAKSQSSFLANQEKFQKANDSIAELNRRQQALQREIRDLDAGIEESKKPAQEEYQRRGRSHQWRVALYKLLFLVPLFLLSSWLVLKKRTTPYAPLFYPALLATSWKVGTVMHEHFPAVVFKYVIIGVSITVVLATILKLIRTVTAPRRDWLLKQNREAYHQHRCPICADPIRRGPLKYALWTRRGPAGRNSTTPSEVEREDTPYSCPACGIRLFEPCSQCEATRHSLLPYCESCGNEKSIAGEAATG